MSSEARADLGQLNDQLALKKLINNYHWCADHFDWQAWADCFTADAVFDFSDEFGTMCGRQQIHDICKGNMDDVYQAMQHVMVNLEFNITGESTATGHGNLIFTAVPDKTKPEQNFQSGGRYNWEFVRSVAGWRITRARLEFIWTRGENVGDVFSASAASVATSAA